MKEKKAKKKRKKISNDLRSLRVALLVASSAASLVVNDFEVKRVRFGRVVVVDWTIACRANEFANTKCNRTHVVVMIFDYLQKSVTANSRRVRLFVERKSTRMERNRPTKRCQIEPNCFEQVRPSVAGWIQEHALQSGQASSGTSRTVQIVILKTKRKIWLRPRKVQKSHSNQSIRVNWCRNKRNG